jgi:hypothetical protein
MTQGTFTNSFDQAVVTTDKPKRILADPTAFTKSVTFSIISYYKLHLNP